MIEPKDNRLNEPSISEQEALVRYYSFEWKADKAAAMLNISRAGFYRLLEKYNMPSRTKQMYGDSLPFINDEIQEIKKKRAIQIDLMLDRANIV